MLLTLWSCDKRNAGVVEPIDPNNLPQVILFDEEEAGELENSDETSFTLKLLDRIDPTGEELGGKIIPLTSDVTVNFEITEFEGFDNIADYILGASAQYEIDDCNDGEVAITFNTTTGVGSVTFPAGVEEVEVNFELNDALFDDDEVNEDSRGFKVKITGLTNATNVVANTELEFEHIVLDDDVIFGEWSFDIADLENLKDIFGDANEDIADLEEDDINEIKIEFGLTGFEIKIELVETELDDCGEEENIEIEIEAEYNDLTDDATSGDISFIIEKENEDGSVEELEYSGTFEINNGVLTITLEDGKSFSVYLD